MSPGMQDGFPTDEGSIPLELLGVAFWRARWLIASCMLIGLVFSVGYLFVAKPTYTASATITASSEGAKLPSAASSLAGSLGVDIGGKMGGDFDNYINILHSVRVAQKLQDKYQVLQQLNSGWNSETHRFDPPQGLSSTIIQPIKRFMGLPTWQPPNAVSLAEFLTRNIVVASSGGVGSSIRTISFDSTSKEFAREFLTNVLTTADDVLRDDKLADTRNRISYLEDAINHHSSGIYVNQSLLQVLQSEQERQMTLRADKFYAIMVLDPPSVSLYPTKPSIGVMLALGAALGLLVGTLIAFVLIRGRFLAPGDESLSARLEQPFQNIFSFLAGLVRSSIRQTGGR